MPGIGFLVNPHARANLRDPKRLQDFARIAGANGPTELTDSLDDLYRAAATFRRQAIDIVAINGGDGTLHVALTALCKSYGSDALLPMVAPLRGGTMDTAARSLGVRGSTDQLLARLVGKYRTGGPFAVVERDLLRIGDGIGFLFGTGVIANYLRLYYATGRPGPLTAAAVLARGIVSSLTGGRFGREMGQRWHGQVTADGAGWGRRDYLAVAAACIDQIGLGFKPFYRAGSAPGKFPVLGIHTNAAGFIAELPRVWSGQPMTSGKAIDTLASALRLESEQPFEYMVDGDLYRAREVEVAVGPRLRFVVA